MTMRAIPKNYSGVLFRSTLEADWAKNLDAMKMVWQYEPEGLILPGNTYYRPDMYLPLITTWVEVKGPHNERLEKAGELQAACIHAPDCIGDQGCSCGGHSAKFPWRLVVVARPGTNGRMAFHGAPCDEMPEPHIVVANCEVCRQYTFADLAGMWKCRRCHSSEGVSIFEAKQLAFTQIDHKAGQYRKKKKR